MFYLLVHKNISETSCQRAVLEEKSYLEKLALIARTFLTACLSVNSLCHLSKHRFQPSVFEWHSTIYHSPCKSRVVLVDVDFGDQPIHNHDVPRNERKVGNCHFFANQVLLLRESDLEHSEDPLDLIGVPFDGAWNLLSVEFQEPRRLAKVRAASVCHWGARHPSGG